MKQAFESERSSQNVLTLLGECNRWGGETDVVGAGVSAHPISTHDWVSSLMTGAITQSQGRSVITGGRERRAASRVLTHLNTSLLFHLLLSLLISASLLTVIPHPPTVSGCSLSVWNEAALLLIQLHTTTK